MQQDGGFFDGFSWAVPTAFANPVATCHFELGDTLYDTRRVYETAWGDALPYLSFGVQVRSPARSVGGQTQDGKASFAENWGQPVVLDFRDYRQDTTDQIRTTQGRLYAMLWKGDTSCLRESREAPSVPMLAMSILSQLPTAVEHVRSTAPPTSRVLFLMPYDPSHELLTAKFARAVDALSNHFVAGFSLVSPDEAGLISETGFAPTVRVACFWIDGRAKEVEHVLKRVLYRPSSQRSGSTDKFRLASHGHLVSL